MADIVKNYLIQQKTNDGFKTLHPQTNADIVLETETKKILTAAEREKLAGIAAGSQANVIEAVKLGEATLTPASKVVTIPVDTTFNTASSNLLPNSVIATKVNELTSGISTNAAGISTNATAIGTMTELSTNDKGSLVGALNEVNAVVGQHSTTIAAHTAAIEANTTAVGNHAASISTLNSKVGTLEGKVETLETGKVDKEAGKGLSTNDYTTVEKEKLAGIAAGAEINVIDSVAASVKSGETVINGVVSENGKARSIELDLSSLFNLKLDASLRGVANGVASLDGDGKVPSSQLPGYVDDVIEGTIASFPSTGETSKVYVDTTTNKVYRWGGTQYVEISASLALGETASTAYAGDKGAQNATNIALNTAAIAQNAANITANSTAITNIQNGIGSATLVTEQKTIKEAINELHAELADLSGSVASDATVSKLATAVFENGDVNGTSKVATNATAIAGINSSIENINTTLGNLQAKDTEIAGNVTALIGRVDTAETNISTISGKVTTLEGTVAGHTTAISNLETADQGINSRLDKLENITGALDTTDKIAVNTAAIAENKAAIEALTSGDGKAKAAEVADKLANAVNVSIKGDVVTTAAKTFDGSSDLELEVSLPDKVEAGIYTAVQVDSKGRVIAGAKDIIVGNDQTDTSSLAIGGLFFREI